MGSRRAVQALSSGSRPPNRAARSAFEGDIPRIEELHEAIAGTSWETRWVDSSVRLMLANPPSLDDPELSSNFASTQRGEKRRESTIDVGDGHARR